jgi:phage portal protein BeeE
VSEEETTAKIAALYDVPVEIVQDYYGLHQFQSDTEALGMKIVNEEVAAVEEVVRERLKRLGR